MAYDTGTHYNPGSGTSESANTDNVATYGFLYDWDTAANKVCPADDGWRLPTKDELTALISLGAENLRATGFASGTDTYGFGALPAGYYEYGDYTYFEEDAAFWSSDTDNTSDFSNPKAYYMTLGKKNNYANIHSDSVTLGISVRCLKAKD